MCGGKPMSPEDGVGAEEDGCDAGATESSSEEQGRDVVVPKVFQHLGCQVGFLMSKTPLYMLSASELGTDSSKVDKVLARTFELFRLRWRAPILLDEADVFLKKRDSNTLVRNELVSIFLRRLEFHRGLMFLTTNRISNIDSAFKSRIDLTLPDHDLDESSRRALWVNFIERHTTETTDINDEGYDELAKADINGRQIKNTVKTAFVLSQHKREQIGMDHLRTVLGIRKRVSVAELDDEPPAKRQKMNGHVWEK